jgi:tight adherence protein B
MIPAEFYLFLIGSGVFYLASLFKTERKYRFTQILTENKRDRYERLKTISETLEKSKYTRFLASGPVIREAVRYGWNISQREYWMIFSVSSVTGMMILSFIGFPSLSFLGLGTGILVPKLMLRIYKAKHKAITEEKLMNYMRAVANAAPVYSNPIDILQSVFTLLDEEIKKDVDKALSYLATGKSVEASFRAMNEKYGYKELRFFHELLDLAQKHGGKYQDSLTTVARSFEQKKLLQMKLRSIMVQSQRAFKQNIILVAGIPFLFKFMAPEMYRSVVNHPLGKAAILFMIISSIYAFIKVDQIVNYDPYEQ